MISIVKNIKLHFQVRSNLLRLKVKEPLKEYFSIQLGQSKAFVFLNSGVVNLTNIKTFDTIEVAKKEFCDHFEIDERIVGETIIDNSTVCQYRKHLIKINKIWRQLQKKDCELIRRIRFNPQRFPALRINTTLGQVNFFASGAVIILGAKSQESIGLLEDFIDSVLSHYG